MTALWIMYFLTPYFYEVIQCISSKRQFMLVCSILILLSVPFWHNVRMIVSITRIPIFFIGMYFASREDKVITFKKIIVMFVLFLIGTVTLRCCYTYYEDLLWLYGLHWYPFVLIVPFMCVCISYMCNRLSRIKIGNVCIKFLDYLGKYTFELFLVHIFVFQVKRDLRSKGLIEKGLLLNILVIVAIVVGVIILRKMVEYLEKLFRRINKKKGASI